MLKYVGHILPWPLNSIKSLLLLTVSCFDHASMDFSNLSKVLRVFSKSEESMKFICSSFMLSFWAANNVLPWWTDCALNCPPISLRPKIMPLQSRAQNTITDKRWSFRTTNLRNRNQLIDVKTLRTKTTQGSGTAATWRPTHTWSSLFVPKVNALSVCRSVQQKEQNVFVFASVASFMRKFKCDLQNIVAPGDLTSELSSSIFFRNVKFSCRNLSFSTEQSFNFCSRQDKYWNNKDDDAFLSLSFSFYFERRFTLLSVSTQLTSFLRFLDKQADSLFLIILCCLFKVFDCKEEV